MKYCPRCQRSYSSTQRFCLEDGEMLALQDPYHLTGRTIIEKYRIETLVGVGGMGAVYKAHHLGLDRCVAFKILLPHLALGNEHLLNLFEREARLTGRLTHENIADVKDAGRTADGLAYIVMEWLEGRTLEEELAASGPLSFERTAGLLRQIAAALDAAHARHIIHRDLKPSNVMLITHPDGRELVKVLDFGIGKVISETAAAPVSAVMGTPHYASPEQFKLGGQIDGRADLYALGVMLYQMLTGAFPFDADSIHELIQLQMTAPPPPLRNLRPDAPPAIEQLVSRLLVKDPEQRPRRAGEVVGLFEAAVRTAAVAKPVTVTEDSRRPMPERAGSHDQDSAAPFNAAADSEVAAISSDSPQTPEEAHQAVAEKAARANISLSDPRRVITHPQRTGLLILAGLGCVIAMAFALSALLRSKSVPFQATPPTLLTTHTKASLAAVSPDGKYVVYVKTEAGQNSLWLKHIATQDPQDEKEIRPPARNQYLGLTFSRDGHYIYCVRTEKSMLSGTLYRIAFFGKTENSLLTDVWGPVSLSPDEKKCVFFRFDSVADRYDLVLASLNDGSQTVLTTRKKPDSFRPYTAPAWSPDGKLIVCVTWNAQTVDMALVILRAEDGAEVPGNFRRWLAISQVAWLPDRSGFVMAAADQQRELAQLWHLSYPGGKARRITTDLSNYIGVSLTADARELVTVQDNSYTNLWVAPKDEISRPAQLTTGIRRHDGLDGLDWTPDDRIIYTSKTGGKPSLWVMRADGSDQQQLTTDRDHVYADPAVSPDGRYVVFASDRAGALNLWRMELNSRKLEQLTYSGGANMPRFSPDGKWVLFDQYGPRKSTPQKISIDGGDPVPLNDKFIRRLAVSPNGKLVAGLLYLYEQDHLRLQIIVFPFEGEGENRTFEMPPHGEPEMLSWSPDGQALHYTHTREDVTNIQSQPLKGGGARQLTNFKEGYIRWFAWSRDGRQLAYAQKSANRDVVLVKDSR